MWILGHWSLVEVKWVELCELNHNSSASAWCTWVRSVLHYFIDMKPWFAPFGNKALLLVQLIGRFRKIPSFVWTKIIPPTSMGLLHPRPQVISCTSDYLTAWSEGQHNETSAKWLTFSRQHFEMKYNYILLKFHFNFSLLVQLKINQFWFR